MLAAGWGRLIAVASTAGLKGYAYVTGYCAAKHGVVGLTRALALETAKTGVTVNAVCPGYTQTPMLERSIETIMRKTGRTRAEAEAALLASTRRAASSSRRRSPQTVLWLCGTGAASVTGQAISSREARYERCLDRLEEKSAGDMDAVRRLQGAAAALAAHPEGLADDRGGAARAPAREFDTTLPRFDVHGRALPRAKTG